MEKEENHAKKQAGMQMESILKMTRNLAEAQEKNDDGAIDNATETIQNDPLEIKTERHYIILLCWGGPAVRIIGELDENGTPETANLQYQDWGTPWTDYLTDTEENGALLLYAEQFYFEPEGGEK